MTARNWCFTLNNYTDDDLTFFRSHLNDSSLVRYAVFGFEVGESGTPHLQGFVSFKQSRRLAYLRTYLSSRGHYEISKGSPEQNFDYCSKAGTFEEFGDRRSSGKRNDLEAFKSAVLEGERDKKKLRIEHSIVAARYPRFFEQFILDCTPMIEIPAHPLRPWQQELCSYLDRRADSRTIYFVVDQVGNAGKSWFARYYSRLNPKCIVLEPGKKADMAYLLPDELRVVFIDITRQQMEHINYSFMESLKNGVVFSNKYESRIKEYGNLHVVVMMNHFPDMKMLSEDRYKIISVT